MGAFVVSFSNMFQTDEKIYVNEKKKRFWGYGHFIKVIVKRYLNS